MTAIYIISGVLLLFLLLLIIPVSADMVYKDKFSLLVKYGGIKVFDTAKPKKEKPKSTNKSSAQAEKQASAEKENFFSKLFKKKGKIEGIKFLARLIKITLSRIIWVIKKIKFKKFFLSISVASDDAASTAISYGAVCAVVYPVINMIDQNTDFSVKHVNIYTDFDKLSPEIESAITLKTRLIYALIAIISFAFAYLKLKKESDKK